MNQIAFAFATLLLVQTGCSGQTASSERCGSGPACAAGALCVNDECVPVCSTDSDCTEPGRICQGDLCVEGSRGDVPVISDVDGDGGEICPETNGNLCVALGLTVTGQRFTGASWKLSPVSGGVSRTLDVRGTATDSRVTLDLPLDVGAGTYILTAVNGAGSADQSLELLRGERGPAGALDQAQVDAMNAAIAAAVPIATVLPYAGGAGTIPDGWLLCDGAEIGRSEYENLFNVIGISHGGGDGTTTFNLPDYRGRFLRGVAGDLDAAVADVRDPDREARTAPQPGAASVGNAGNLVGSVEGTATALPNSGFTASEAGSHDHGYNDNSGWNSCGTPQGVDCGGTNESGFIEDHERTTSPAGAHAHTVDGGDAESRPPNSYIHFIIKY